MNQKLLFCSILAVLVLPSPVRAGESEYGTTQEAQAMLLRAAAAVKADKLDAIVRFNANEPQFRDRDLFVFCFNSGDGTITAHEAFVGKNIRSIRDVSGKRYGEEMYRVASEGKVSAVMFTSPLPGTTRKLPKRAYVTAVGGQACGVSAYQFGSLTGSE